MNYNIFHKYSELLISTNSTSISFLPIGKVSKISWRSKTLICQLFFIDLDFQSNNYSSELKEFKSEKSKESSKESFSDDIFNIFNSGSQFYCQGTSFRINEILNHSNNSIEFSIKADIINNISDKLLEILNNNYIYIDKKILFNFTSNNYLLYQLLDMKVYKKSNDIEEFIGQCKAIVNFGAGTMIELDSGDYIQYKFIDKADIDNKKIHIIC